MVIYILTIPIIPLIKLASIYCKSERDLFQERNFILGFEIIQRRLKKNSEIIKVVDYTRVLTLSLM